MTDKPTITQADREAAWAIRPNFFGKHDYADWRNGVYDRGGAIEVLAKHRESSVAELQAKVERLMTQNERFRVVLRIISTEHISIYRSSKAGRIATRVLEQNKPIE